MGLNLVELGGYLLPLQLEIVTEHRGEDGGRFQSMALRAVSDGNVSEPFVTVEDVPIMAGDIFAAEFPESALPAAFSPTGSDVRFRLNMAGRITSESTFCGTITGEITTLDQPLTMSTFAVEPWEGRSETAPSDCAGNGGGGMACDRIDMCPDVAVGVNMLSSCEEDRIFRVFAPDDMETDETLPLIFLWHGLGSDPDALLDRSLLAEQVNERRFVLVVPSSRALPVEWDQLGQGDNPDLAFFDDMVTCVQTAFPVDTNRIYSTGLSAGGLWTTYLGLRRASVIAAIAPMSGGLIVDYVAPERTLPVLVSWGGIEDIAVEQDFNTFALALIEDLQAAGHELVTCNHGQGHEWLPSFNPWVLQFLFDHTLDGSDPPYAMGLPEVFPDYCRVASE
jgi:predicted esterase